MSILILILILFLTIFINNCLQIREKYHNQNNVNLIKNSLLRSPAMEKDIISKLNYTPTTQFKENIIKNSINNTFQNNSFNNLKTSFPNKSKLNKILTKDSLYSPKMSQTDIHNLKIGQKIMTRMLHEFDKICIKYHLQYWCTGGTLIGILHSNDWLPWDGDVDVCMLTSDYVVLENIIQQELPNDMWFQSAKTDKYFKRENGNKNHLPSKIRHLYSCYLKCQDGVKWHNGLQIDISTYNQVGNMLITNFNKDINDYIDYQYNFIFPLRRERFNNIYVYIPNKHKEYSILNWGYYPPRYSKVEKRYPHEGMISLEPCKHHYRLYPELY